MPHMKFRGDLDLESLWRKPPAFRFSVPEEDLHFKFTEAFLGGRERVLMLRFVVAEGRLTQYVQVILASGGEEWVLKLDRAYPILRTAGIKLLLATLGGWLVQKGLTPTFSTIQAYEERGRFYAAHQPFD